MKIEPKIIYATILLGVSLFLGMFSAGIITASIALGKELDITYFFPVLVALGGAFEACDFIFCSGSV